MLSKMLSKATPQITPTSPWYVAKQESWQGSNASDWKDKPLSSSLFPLILFCQAKKNAALPDDPSRMLLQGVTSTSSSLTSVIIDTVAVHCCFTHWGLVRCWDRNNYFKKKLAIVAKPSARKMHGNLALHKLLLKFVHVYLAGLLLALNS